ncbi:conserved exported hypothetical protein [Magnetospirillum sp. LM-5]|uniref:hypothetical protein n=1 Tax=Magnetospirillum sp. LM-5 TaxID=2681466 RepID=UPI0013813DED|nr:hypothetical protein [Magnetospirillum sp. LM-5]CAA7622420.1 conserved exported hypothetical protein [Magnetospirillum sp. LM-5]
MPIAVLFLILAAGLAFLAYPADADAETGPRARELKRIESQSHRDRIKILEQADRCIAKAENRQDYRACEEAEAQARKDSNLKARDAKQALRRG